MTVTPERLTIRSILLWAATGAITIGLCTTALSTWLFLDRLKAGTHDRVSHVAELGAMSIEQFLANAKEVVRQVTSRTRARDLLIDLSQGTIDPEDYRRQTQRILGDALRRTEPLRAIARLDKDQRRVAAVGERIGDAVMPGGPELSTGEEVAGPFAYNGSLRISVAAPILDPRGNPLGTDVALFSLEQLAQIMRVEGGSDRSLGNPDLYLVDAGSSERTYFYPTGKAEDPLLPTSAEVLVKAESGSAELRALEEGIVASGDLVFASRRVEGSEWLVLVRQSTADLYGGVYRDLAVSLITALVLSAGGALGLVVLIGRFARKLGLQLEGLRDEIRSSEARYRDLVEGSLQGILVHRDHRPLLVNKAWSRIHGMSVQEVMRLASIQPLMADEDRQRMVHYKHARLKGLPAPERYEYRAVRKDGSLVWVENRVRSITWDGAPAIQTTIVDISERKAREEADTGRHDTSVAALEQKVAEA